MAQRPAFSNLPGTEAAHPAVNNPFSDKAIRRSFIRKVYLILTIQILMTTAVIAAFVFVPEMHKFARKYPFVGLLCSIGGLMLLISWACCCPGLSRHFPVNFVMLFGFTALEALSLGIICVFYRRNEVLLAAGITAVLFIALTTFAMQTKIDFTPLAGILYVCLIIFCLFGIIVIFFGKYFPMLNAIYACAGAFIFVVYIIVDTQMIMGGGRSVQISPEDYINACLVLYLDIINLFLFILDIVNQTNDG